MARRLISRRDGAAFPVVEHDAEQALRVADCVHVMELGRIVAQGMLFEISRDPVSEKAYLGCRADAANRAAFCKIDDRAT